MCAHVGYDKCDMSRDDESEAACITVIKKKYIRKQYESYLRKKKKDLKKVCNE